MSPLLSSQADMEPAVLTHTMCTDELFLLSLPLLSGISPEREDASRNFILLSCQSNGKTRKSLKSPQQNISLLHLFSLVIAAHGDNFQKCLTLLLSGEIMVHSWRVLSTDAWLYWSGHVFMVIIGHIGCRKSTPPTNFKSEVSGIQLVMHLAVIEYFTAKFLAAQQQKLEKI